MTSFENLTKSQKLRASLHRDVMAICKETCHLVGMEMTKPAMEVIAELVHKKIGIYARDLEAFAKHAKRSTINAEDVKLLVRRNPTLPHWVRGLILYTALAPLIKESAENKVCIALGVAGRPNQISKKAHLSTMIGNQPASSSKVKRRKTNPSTSAPVKETPNAQKSKKEIEPEKPAEKETDNLMEDAIDDVILSDTIDLTFD